MLIFYYVGKTEWIQSKTVNLPQTKLLLIGLNEDTDYKLIGVALEGTTGFFLSGK